MVVHFVKLLEVLVSSCRMFPYNVESSESFQKASSAFLCLLDFLLDGCVNKVDTF